LLLIVINNVNNMTYHLVTLGCQMNKSDSERVRTIIEELGYTWTDQEEQAALIGILACSVRQKAIDKVYSRIHKWNTWKKNRNLLTFLTGCVLPADRKKMLRLFDLVFEMEELAGLGNLIKQYGVVTPVSINLDISGKSAGEKFVPTDVNPDLTHFSLIEITKQNGKLRPDDLEPIKHHRQNISNLGNFWNINPTYTSEFEAYVPIQNGCDKFCTFCAVPYTRGREVSRPSAEILEEIGELLAHNYKSVTLLGQNVNSYGHDKKGKEISFPKLLEKVGQMCDSSGKEVWIYFTSPHPRDMTDEVIQVISRYKSLGKQIHLPIQSGDDEVLRRMNRKHSMVKYREIIKEIRLNIPSATIFTDIIVGFTGETEEQFENTRKIMEEFRFNMAYIAMYSPRPGAVSSEWPDNIPQNLKKERLYILSEDLRKYSSEYNRQLVGKTIRSLVTGYNRKEGFLSGFTEGKIITRFRSNRNDLIGQFVDIKITSAADFSVEGVLSPVKKAELIQK
jgi:tRNA-2-methylthio-N6-dimethylallyladenosine synthase